MTRCPAPPDRLGGWPTAASAAHARARHLRLRRRPGGHRAALGAHRRPGPGRPRPADDRAGGHRPVRRPHRGLLARGDRAPAGPRAGRRRVRVLRPLVPRGVRGRAHRHRRHRRGASTRWTGAASPPASPPAAPTSGCEFTLGHTGLYERFAGRIFSATEVAEGKPSPLLFLYAAEQMGVPPADCLVIEDSRYGVQAAVAAGMRVAGYSGSVIPADALHEAGATSRDRRHAQDPRAPRASVRSPRRGPMNGAR